MSILKNLQKSSDIKNLSLAELELLAQEIREVIINSVENNGGHLSANLGVVELTLALYYVFDFPTDKLFFDVGHQCYAHKILSGRADDMSTLRREGGVSGFPESVESEYDYFTAGHAGNAVAGGLGTCYARDLLGEDFKVISLVGDASMTNGLSLEALNASDDKPNNFIVILNDNGMSITKNENGLYKKVIGSTTNKPYLAIKGGAKKLLGKTAFGRFLSRTKDFFKRLFNAHVYIDDMGFKYVGTINGHNLKELISTLKRAKEYKKACFIHVATVKGKGFALAEANPERYHGVTKNMQVSENDFSEKLGAKLCEVAKNNDKITAITAGMTGGVGLTEFSKQYPDRFFDVGISEEFAVTLSAGMARTGLKPFVCIYSTFLQRAYDQIIHDVCIQNLPVVFCIDRAGVVGSDGKTHQGVFDLSYLRHIPNMHVLCPKDLTELDGAIDYALTLNAPVAIRYPNGKQADFSTHTPFNCEYEVVKDGIDAVVLCVGGRTLSVALELEKFGVNAMIVNARLVKPLDKEFLNSIKDKLIITVEDNAIAGGFGSAVMEYYAQNGINAKVVPFGIKDEFVPHASVTAQFIDNGITTENIANTIKNFKD